MPTNEERRDIATKLHAIDRENFASSYSEEFEIIEKILGIWEDYDKFVWHVIADLIEPEPERTCRPEKRWKEYSEFPYYVCSECGEPLNYRETEYGYELLPYCAGCGAMVIE